MKYQCVAFRSPLIHGNSRKTVFEPLSIRTVIMLSPKIIQHLSNFNKIYLLTLAPKDIIVSTKIRSFEAGRQYSTTSTLIFNIISGEYINRSSLILCIFLEFGINFKFLHCKILAASTIVLSRNHKGRSKIALLATLGIMRCCQHDFEVM